MKGKVGLVFSLFLLLNMITVRAQLAKSPPKEFIEIKKRPLIVELLEIDEAYIASKKKKIAKANKAEKKAELQDDIDNHTKFISKYNEGIKYAVEKYWDLNQNIEYKTREEVEKLRKAKSKKYAVLFFTEYSTSIGDNGFTYKPGITLPTLIYTRIEKGSRSKIDYVFLMASVHSTVDKLSHATFVINIKIMKNHIAEIERRGNKHYIPKQFAKDQAKINCSNLQGKQLYLDEAFIKKESSKKEILNASTRNPIQLVTSDEISQSIINEEDKIYSINIPYGIKSGSSSTGGYVNVTLTVARVEYMKTLVNAKSGEILYVNGVSIGEMYDGFWRPVQIKKIGNCK